MRGLEIRLLRQLCRGNIVSYACFLHEREQTSFGFPILHAGRHKLLNAKGLRSKRRSLARIQVIESLSIRSFLFIQSNARILKAHSGTPELGGAGGAAAPVALYPLPGEARGAKMPFQFKGLPWRNSELSEMLVQFFYEIASENAGNAVIELQE